MGRQAIALAERFDAKWMPEPNTGCHLWMASGDDDGYGRLWRNDYERTDAAHRIAWELAHGPIPEEMHVLHRCDTPSCVNVAHLFLGTNAENMSDREAKGRTARGDRAGSRLHPDRVARGERHSSRTHPERVARGERAGSAKLTEDQVREIRARVASGETQTAVAMAYGVSRGMVTHILMGIAWKHVR